MPSRRQLAIAALFFAWFGCPEGSSAQVRENGEHTEMTKTEKPVIDYDHEAQEKKARESLQLLIDAERAAGGKPLVAAGGVPLKFDVAVPAPDPMAAMERCSDWVMGCFEHESKKRGVAGPAAISVLEECIRAAPRCQSTTPWKEARACCAARCIEIFDAARARGKAPLDAWNEALLEKQCMPGVAELLKPAENKAPAPPPSGDVKDEAKPGRRSR